MKIQMKIQHALGAAAMTAALAAPPSLVLASGVNAALAGINTAEAPRVTQAVDNNVVNTLVNTHLTRLGQAKVSGAVDDSMPMPHMQLMLKPSALRSSALQSLISAQHDPTSAGFHQWITPAEFGATFGAGDADILAVESWLKSQGFTVNSVYPNKMQIDFSGTAGTVRKAFHTRMNRYETGIPNGGAGQSHVANDRDISIPAALADVVTGVAGLNDFHPKALIRTPQLSQYDRATHLFALPEPAATDAKAQADATIRQAITGTNGVRGLVPNDMQTIYNTAPLYASGLTGAGTTIAVVEDLGMDPSDWTNFVGQFGLGSFGGTFTQFEPQPASGPTNCTDPGGESASTESIETVLDSEYTTAMAPGANIWVAICSDSATNNFFGGVYLAANNLINNPSASGRPNIISASYGFGELDVDAASKAAIDTMWAQADAEGISVFVSSGDSGSNPSFNGSIIGLGGPAGASVDANALATSPNDTAVGGTDTADVLDGTSSKYFNSTPNALYGTAKSYVPELTWNESCGNTLAAQKVFKLSVLTVCKDLLLFGVEAGAPLASEAGSGGPSSVVAKPAWQRIVRGAAKDKSRDLPDVSLFAGSFGNSTFVVLCTGSAPCTPGFTSQVVLEGGTSLSAPMFAGIQALLDQGLSQAGAFSTNQGNAAPTLYNLAKDEYGGPSGAAPASLSNCNSDNGTKGTGNCVFHNITEGGISTNCVQITAIQGIPFPEPPTPDCYLYGSGTLLGGLAELNIGLTSLSTTSYVPAYPAQAGWSFANGLGSVNAVNLLKAWEKFDALR
jgi:subtilase family serine protease